jgi:UDP-N-acetylmuramoyl-tripeptide--D-alanyl-D-alanine ligase
MSFHATLARLISLLAAKPQHLSDNALASTCTGINTDTRSLKPGDIFVALRGEKFDGHGFVATAVEKGAIAAIVDGHYQGDLPVLQVRDTLQAYACYWCDWFCR